MIVINRAISRGLKRLESFRSILLGTGEREVIRTNNAIPWILVSRTVRLSIAPVFNLSYRPECSVAGLPCPASTVEPFTDFVSEAIEETSSP